MRPWRSRAIATIALTAALVGAAGRVGEASADSAGAVHFVRAADSSFDQFTSGPSPAAQAWLRGHMWRMIVWSPYFDSRTSWYRNGWVYDDAYAIYAGEQLASEHPDWILRDSHGNKLYIPWGCSGGTCPQYAGDISNLAFRRYWIEDLKARAAHGYRGVFIDDVNMDRQVGNGQEELVAPIDPSTGQPVSEDAWRHYMARFMQEVRAALPTAEIVHNVIWFAGNHAGTANAEIKDEISSANLINLERGANDSGLTGGDGAWSLNALLAYADQVHALGRNVVLDGGASDAQGLAYNLAAYLLVSNGGDGVSGGGQTPASWWTGWSVALGEASGARYGWSGLLRRDFTGGMVLVNPPGSPTVTISLPAQMQDVDGNSVGSVTLPAASGAVLRGNVPAAALARKPAAVATKTIVETSAVGPYHPRAVRHHRARGRQHAHRRKSATRGHQARSRRARVPRHEAVLARISGMVLHATRGMVTVQIERRAGKRWVALRHLRVRVDPAGRFVGLVGLHTAVRYRVRAVYAGAAGYRPSRSPYRPVVLRAP